MTRPISTRLHGVIDYTWAATASALSGRIGGATSTARLLRGAATAATANSFITNYECGAVRVMPMKGHLAMDAVLCGALVAAPLLLPASERRYVAIPMLLGALGLAAARLTEWRSPTEEQDEEFGGLYGGGERWAIADHRP